MKHRNSIFIRRIALCLILTLCIPLLSGNEVQAASSLKKPTFSVTSRTKTKAVIKIDKKDTVTGYQVYVKKGKNGKYQLWMVAFNRTCTIKNLKQNSEYYVKILSYRTQGNSIKKSKYSAAKKIGKYKKPAEDKKDPSVEEPSSQEQYAEEVLALVNEERAKEGLAPLVLDAKLNEAAMIRANEIISNFSHTRPNGTDCFTVLQENSINYLAAGENIAAGQSTPATVMDRWMNSEGHRANIMSSTFGKVGIGFVKSSDGYQYYWVQIFTD